MRRSGRNVGGYRGRRTSRDILTIVAAVLAVAVILVLGGLALGQRYIVYTDDGLRLDLPFFSDGSRTELPDPGNVSLVEKPASSQEQEAPPAEEPEPVYMAALELPLETVVQGTAAEQLDRAGADVLILNMKNAQGLLGWKSSQGLADQAEVNGTQTAADAIRTWNQGDVYTVARVCCFRDNAVPYHRNALALRATYGNWRDELGLRWLDPGNKDVRAYLAALCGELAELGFDEILLEQYTLPVLGNRETLLEDHGDQAEQLVNDLLDRVARAVEPYGTRVSLRIEPSVVKGEAPWCGLSLADAETDAYRLWIETVPGEDLCARLEMGGISEADQRLVMLTSELGETEDGHEAVLMNS